MNKIKKQSKSGFSLVELLVVIAIIGILSTLSVIALNNAREKARDARRITDIKQVQTALELYYNDENSYPSSVTMNGTAAITGPTSSTTFMAIVPAAPTPADGDCTDGQNTYTYSRDSVSSYHITYCLGGATGGITAGAHSATAISINDD